MTTLEKFINFRTPVNVSYKGARDISEFTGIITSVDENFISFMDDKRGYEFMVPKNRIIRISSRFPVNYSSPFDADDDNKDDVQTKPTTQSSGAWDGLF